MTVESPVKITAAAEWHQANFPRPQVNSFTKRKAALTASQERKHHLKKTLNP